MSGAGRVKFYFGMSEAGVGRRSWASILCLRRWSETCWAGTGTCLLSLVPSPRISATSCLCSGFLEWINDIINMKMFDNKHENAKTGNKWLWWIQTKQCSVFNIAQVICLFLTAWTEQGSQQRRLCSAGEDSALLSPALPYLLHFFLIKSSFFFFLI